MSYINFGITYIVESITQTLHEGLLEINLFDYGTVLVSAEASIDLIEYAKEIPSYVLDMLQNYDYTKSSAY